MNFTPLFACARNISSHNLSCWLITRWYANTRNCVRWVDCSDCFGYIGANCLLIESAVWTQSNQHWVELRDRAQMRPLKDSRQWHSFGQPLTPCQDEESSQLNKVSWLNNKQVLALISILANFPFVPSLWRFVCLAFKLAESTRVRLENFPVDFKAEMQKWHSQLVPHSNVQARGANENRLTTELYCMQALNFRQFFPTFPKVKRPTRKQYNTGHYYVSLAGCVWAWEGKS